MFSLFSLSDVSEGNRNDVISEADIICTCKITNIIKTHCSERSETILIMIHPILNCLQEEKNDDKETKYEKREL